ncbi:MAG: molybdate ABC transporter substrate-binding protein [Tropicimonas sp.]|uniref:molybdate ABC transporter substrate-binding protein n=1 Tax=Tropicimonas sp. TaxID=2067044 RepID=UPI003A898974
MRNLSSALLAAAVTVAFAGGAPAGDLTLAAGAGYRKPVSEAVAAFEAETGNKVGMVFGNMGQVIAQAKESGAIGMVCGDRAKLEGANGLEIKRFVPFGKGALVVGYRKGLDLAAPEDIAAGSVERVAMPDEKAAIYGVAGRQYLENAGLASAVDPKLLIVATVPQVTAYLTRGEVDAGLLNATDALGAGDNIGGFLPVDPALYEPIRIDCGLLDEAGAAAFADFLGTEAVREIATKYGM